MTTPRDHQSQTYEKARNELGKLFESKDTLSLETAGSRSLEAWFLGPKAENADVLERLIVEAIRDQAYWRRNYHPEDPSHITEKIKRSPEYLEAMDALNEGYHSLLAVLKKSVPFFSPRYQGHMDWDLTIPGIVGYFATMLYNPNNVAFEASTVTTYLELIVGEDLCKMLGYTFPPKEDTKTIRPWGHITCDGTIANIEAIWSARNLKFYPIALKAAIIQEPELSAAKDITVRAYNESSKLWVDQRLIDLTPWQLLNLQADDILALPTRITDEYKIQPDTITTALKKYSVQDLGIHEFSSEFLSDTENPIASPVFFVPGTKHYSFPKAAALLGIGASHLIDVQVNEHGRMNTSILRTLLNQYLQEKRPVYTVVAVMGSTEESAVDPLDEILKIRDEYRDKGLDFTVHADAAWGGYFASLLRDDFEMQQPPFVQARLIAAAPPPVSPLSDYVTTQFEALGRADTITVDPHKAGYIPYPAGALCYRNSAMRDLLTFEAPYIIHDEAEPKVGVYGVEGSKPGAAPAAVYLSHRVIRPSKSGYGKILGQALFSCDKLYARLLCMAKPEDRFIVVPLPNIPDSTTKEEIGTLIDGKTNQEIESNERAIELLKEIGPDQNIFVYAFNFKTLNGQVNQDLDKANEFNKELFKRLSIAPKTDIYGYDLIVSTTDFKEESYGSPFINAYKKRLLEVDGSEGTSITVLRSVVMDPWVTETTQGSFIDVLEQAFRKAVNDVLDAHTKEWGVWVPNT